MEFVQLPDKLASIDVLPAETAGDSHYRAVLSSARLPLASWSAFFVPLFVYVYSMQRFVGFWDVGEMQTVPYILGIAHPTGFPAFTLIGWLFSHSVPFGNVAWRMTLMCALAMSGAAWFIYRLVRDETGDAAMAVLSAWFFAFTDLAWVRGTRTEVHALSTLFIAATLYCIMRWARTEDDRFLYAAAVAWAFGIATHPVAALLGVGLFLMVMYRWQTVSARALAGSLGICLIITAALYAYLPLRSAQVSAQRLDPTLALGIAAGRPFWDYGHPANWNGFVQLVTGSDFPVGAGIAAIFMPETYLLHGGRYVVELLANITIAGLLLVCLGVVLVVRRSKLRAIGFLVAGLSAVPFALGYPIESDVARYYLPSFVVCGVLAGCACAAIAARWPGLRAMVLAGFAVIVGLQFWMHSSLMAQRTDPGAQRYIAFVRSHTPPNAILMSPWTYATPLAYAAYVEHSLGDRVVETAWLSDDLAELPRWIKERSVFIVDVPWGDLPHGYQIERLAGGDPPVYRVLRMRP